MNCPKCGSTTKVIDTYTQPKAVYRIRRCTQCNNSFDTKEEIIQGNVPRRWRKDANDTHPTEHKETVKVQKVCKVCGSTKCFYTAYEHIVCTSSACPAYYTPVPSKFNKEEVIKYLQERGITVNE